MFKVLVSIILLFFVVMNGYLIHDNLKIELQNVDVLLQVASATRTIKQQEDTIEYQRATIMKQNNVLMDAKTTTDKQMGTLKFVSTTLNQCMDQNKELKVIAGIR